MLTERCIIKRNAILDRLIHHACIIKITGPSYRLKGKMDLIESKKNSNN
ncbi:ATP-binding protein [Proteiniborus sp.]